MFSSVAEVHLQCQNERCESWHFDTACNDSSNSAPATAQPMIFDPVPETSTALAAVGSSKVLFLHAPFALNTDHKIVYEGLRSTTG